MSNVPGLPRPLQLFLGGSDDVFRHVPKSLPQRLQRNDLISVVLVLWLEDLPRRNAHDAGLDAFSAELRLGGETQLHNIHG